ncbi:MAG TPA: hypothetical protein EYP19_04380 [Desulfobacterales bacterium]|nr:hypothetical protein [Desulfobacterales bacterium]
MLARVYARFSFVDNAFGVMRMIESTINPQTKTYPKEATLARIIEQVGFKPGYAVQVLNFIYRFAVPGIQNAAWFEVGWNTRQ